jgi:hypothetical protein
MNKRQALVNMARHFIFHRMRDFLTSCATSGLLRNLPHAVIINRSGSNILHSHCVWIP